MPYEGERWYDSSEEARTAARHLQKQGLNTKIIRDGDGYLLKYKWSAKRARKQERKRGAEYERGYRAEFGKRNPRRVRRNSTTLRNIAVVKITRNRDGTVGIVARRNKRGR